jgi:hypothetical protein
MELLALSTGVAIAYGVGLWLVLIVAPLTVTALKGHWLLFVAGWLTLGIAWWIAASRLARPGGPATSTARRSCCERRADTEQPRAISPSQARPRHADDGTWWDTSQAIAPHRLLRSVAGRDAPVA